MKYFMYSIKDLVSGIYGQPSIFINDDVAIRDFAFYFRGKDNIMSANASDYELYKIGIFIPEFGNVEPVEKILIARGEDYAV